MHDNGNKHHQSNGIQNNYKYNKKSEDNKIVNNIDINNEESIRLNYKDDDDLKGIYFIL